jgi:hypothetical protein
MKRERAASPDVVEVCADDGDAAHGGDNRAAAAANRGLFLGADQSIGVNLF